MLPDGIEQTTDPLATRRALKAEQKGTGIYVAGGGTLATAVLDELDPLILKINPVVLGAGIRLFAHGALGPATFRLVQSRPFTSGVVINEYCR